MTARLVRLASGHMPVQEAPDAARHDEVAAAISKPGAVQEYMETAPAFPAMLEIGRGKLTGDTIKFDIQQHHIIW